VRRVFETTQDGNGVTRCTRGIDAGADVEQAVAKGAEVVSEGAEVVSEGAEVVSEDDSEFHVADGLQPPPPYAP
jgi:hypothetical protein